MTDSIPATAAPIMRQFYRAGVAERPIHPPPSREPSCEHDGHQPASVCEVCAQGPRLRAWIDGWQRYREYRARSLYRAANACAETDLKTAIELRQLAGRIERGEADAQA